jgi:aquaporin NIP
MTLPPPALFGAPVTGASVNPARSLGPALVGSTWEGLWIYLTGPVAGASLGALAYQLVRGDPGTTVRGPARGSVG